MLKILRRKLNSFSILEVIIALAFLGIVVIPVFMIFHQLNFTSVKTEDYLKAALFSSMVSEAFRGAGYNSLLKLLKENQVGTKYKLVEEKFDLTTPGMKSYNVLIQFAFYPIPDLDENFSIPTAYKNDINYLVQVYQTFFKYTDRIQLGIMITWFDKATRRKKSFRTFTIITRKTYPKLNFQNSNP